MNDIRHSFAKAGLVRSREGRVLGGVLAGLGRRFGLAPWTARLLFVLLLLIVRGSQLLVYPILWILMPSEETVTEVHTAPAPATSPDAGPAPPVVAHRTATGGAEAAASSRRARSV